MTYVPPACCCVRGQRRKALQVQSGVRKDPSITKKIPGVLQFVIQGSSAWVIDLRSAAGRVLRVSSRAP